MIARPSAPLSGRVRVPSDKSISHRALILGALAEGQTRITHLLEADDVLRTAAALRALGAEVEKDGDVFTVTGTQWRSPPRTLYCGNSGTGVRLLMGAVAGQGIEVRFDGDRSLRKRPMGRILDPLAEMGARSDSDEGRLPVGVSAAPLRGIRYRLPKPSAQIKSAVLLAALGAEGDTVIEEPVPSRDHTERMLPAFGVPVGIDEEGGERRITITGGVRLRGTDIVVPADPSSAAFPIAAALVTPGSAVTVAGILDNPHRVGLYEVLKEMGADLKESEGVEAGGERTMNLTARYGLLRAVTVGPDRVPSMIDEYPILAVIAAFAEGTSRFEGLGELRVKESDRLAATAALLEGNGIVCRTGEDWLEVDGLGGKPRGGGMVETHDDHRIAMSALVLGLGAQNPVSIDDSSMIGTSFPGFLPLMRGLGAHIEETGGSESAVR